MDLPSVTEEGEEDDVRGWCCQDTAAGQFRGGWNPLIVDTWSFSLRQSPGVGSTLACAVRAKALLLRSVHPRQSR